MGVDMIIDDRFVLSCLLLGIFLVVKSICYFIRQRRR